MIDGSRRLQGRYRTTDGFGPSRLLTLPEEELGVGRAKAGAVTVELVHHGRVTFWVKHVTPVCHMT